MWSDSLIFQSVKGYTQPQWDIPPSLQKVVGEELLHTQHVGGVEFSAEHARDNFTALSCFVFEKSQMSRMYPAFWRLPFAKRRRDLVHGTEPTYMGYKRTRIVYMDVECL